MTPRGFADTFKSAAPTTRREHDAVAAKLKKDGQNLDRQRAAADYAAVRDAAAANMARLRDMRLARDAAEALAAPPKEPAPVKARKRAKSKVSRAQPHIRETLPPRKTA
jgi:hypothetical protein